MCCVPTLTLKKVGCYTFFIDFEEGVTALDLFAGTGSITLELLSRGCSRVVSVEKDPQHYAFIRSVVAKLADDAADLLRADVFRYLDRCCEQFDFIFADPPYALKELEQLPDLVFAKNLLAPDGLFVLEHGKTQNFSNHPHFLEHRSYGSVNFSFFGNAEQEEMQTEEPASAEQGDAL